jgi:hypothetical protein
VRKRLREASIRQHVLGKICVERRLDVNQGAFAVIGITDLSDHEGSLAEAQARVAGKQRHRGPNGFNVDGDLGAEINAALFDGGGQIVADAIGISSRIRGDDDAATAANEFVHAQVFVDSEIESRAAYTSTGKRQTDDELSGRGLWGTWRFLRAPAMTSSSCAKTSANEMLLSSFELDSLLKNMTPFEDKRELKMRRLRGPPGNSL